MPSKQRRRKVTLSENEQLYLAKSALEDKKKILELQEALLQTEYKFFNLKQKLVNLLLPEQIDAAKTCGVTPEMYALEWIEMCKKDLRNFTPSWAVNVRGLVELKNGSY